MTAVALTAPAPGTSAAAAAGKAATDAGAGFANALLALLEGPAAAAITAPGQQQSGTDGEAVPGDGQHPVPADAPAVLPRFAIPAVTAPRAETAAGVPGASVPSPALPAPRPDALAVSRQPALADVPQNQPVAAVLPGEVPADPAAQLPGHVQPVVVEDEQEPAGADGLVSAPAAPAQFATAQSGMPVVLAAAVPAKQDTPAPAASGQRPQLAAPGPGVAPSPAAPAAPLVKVPAVAVPAASARGTHPAASPDALPAPVSDAAAAFGQVAAAAGPSQPASVPAATPAAQDLQVPRGYTAQLARPLFTIAAAGPGQHTMTVEVNPQNLGPVTLQAHSDADGIRIEMIAATTDGREALRQALPELRKDLAGAGINASLDLSSSGQGSAQGGQDRESFARRLQTSNQPPDGGRLLEVKAQNTPTRPGLYGPETTLDVLA